MTLTTTRTVFLVFVSEENETKIKYLGGVRIKGLRYHHSELYHVIMSPLSQRVGTCRFTFDRSVRPLSLYLCVPSYRADRQTRNVEPMLG